ncbi:MAG: aromatic acid/H+ symport family MFS transporter [Nocardioidaceae bacterium]|nr:aromatic acid/H+ symport family MFS transporter [Nocardioidaceae bacterium]
MDPSVDAPSSQRAMPGAHRWAVALCWLAVAFDGFDLVVLGAVIPTLIETGDLGFDPASATLAATVGLVGVGLGALAIGPLTDRFGRRRTLIACVASFSLFTLLIAVAPSLEVFVALRFLAGLGLGGCLPIALAFMSEASPDGRAGAAVTRTMTGYHVGAVLTALLALLLVQELGLDWRSLFVVGGVAGLVSVPLMWARMPESEAYLRAREAGAAGTQVASAPVAALLRGRYLRISIGLWVASFMGLLLVYGLNTWLPTIMRAAGYEVGASLGLLLVLNVGAVAGLVVGGRVSDARGNKPSVLAWFALAAVFLAGLSIRLESQVLLYVAVFVTGFFVFSAQVLVYAFVGQLYPTDARGTALGFASGVGRLGAILGPSITGVLVTAGIEYPWGFYVFSLAAVLAVVALSFVPADRPVADPVTTA